jgi:glutaredoxin
VAHLILYSKPGCHLCEGLQEKLESLTAKGFSLEVRDITQQPEWQQAYEYDVPVLYLVVEGQTLGVPRFSPRLSAAEIERRLQRLALERSH